MPTAYRLSDGSTVDHAGGKLTPEEQAWLTAQGAKPLEFSTKEKIIDVLKGAGSGLAEGAISAPFIGGDLFALGARGVDKIFGEGTTSAQNKRFMSEEFLSMLQDETGIKTHVPQTQAGRYANSIGNAVGGGVLAGTGGFKAALNYGSMPGVSGAVKSALSSVIRNPVAQNTAIGAGGEFVGDVSRGFDTEQQQNPSARAAGSLATAIIAILSGRAATPRHGIPLYEATKDIPSSGWAQANAETSRLQRAGVTQNTVGDALPATSQVGAIEREISNTIGGQPLHAKLVGRGVDGGDIPRLLAEAKTRAQSMAAPNPLPAGTLPSQVDEAVFSQAKANRTASAVAPMSGQMTPRADIVEILRRMRQEKLDPVNRGTVDDAYLSAGRRTIAHTPLYPTGPAPQGPGPLPRMSGPTPVTPVGPQPVGPIASGPAVAGQIPAPQTPLLPAPQGNALATTGPMGGMLTPPGLNTIPDNGWSQFSMTGAAPDITTINPLMQRPPMGANLEALSKNIKSLKQAVPRTQQAAGRALDSGASSNAYRVADETLKELSPPYRQAMENYRNMSPQVNLADMLRQKNLSAMPTGAATDPTRMALADHLASINPAQSGSISEKLRAADILARNSSERGIESLAQTVGQSNTATLMNFFGSTARMANIGTRIKANKLLSQLLVNPTPENIKILEELAKRDPALVTVRRDLSNLGAINATTQTEGSQP